MQIANFTKHAETRLGERSKLSPENLKRLLDNNVWIPLAPGKGARQVKRLLYSSPDHGWLTVVQDIADGSVLTVFPVDYHGKRHKISLDQRRIARRRTQVFENLMARGIVEPLAPALNPGSKKKADRNDFKKSDQTIGWNGLVRCLKNGQIRIRNLAGTLPVLWDHIETCR